MSHPYEELADLLDGTLDEENLAGVQSHLDTCASCRDDVAHATAGREAARSLPQAAAPAELHRDVVLAAGDRGYGPPTWHRWAGVAAAAAVVVALAIARTNEGGGG
jgi:anti-sigma factor RsiW